MSHCLGTRYYANIILINLWLDECFVSFLSFWPLLGCNLFCYILKWLYQLVLICLNVFPPFTLREDLSCMLRFVSWMQQKGDSNFHIHFVCLCGLFCCLFIHLFCFLLLILFVCLFLIGNWEHWHGKISIASDYWFLSFCWWWWYIWICVCAYACVSLILIVWSEIIYILWFCWFH